MSLSCCRAKSVWLAANYRDSSSCVAPYGTAGSGSKAGDAPCADPKRRVGTSEAAVRHRTLRVDRRGRELGGGSRLGARGGWRRSRKVWRAPHAKLSHRDELDTPYRVDWWRLGASAPRLVGVVASAAPLEATDRSWKWPNRAQPISELVSGPTGHVCTGSVGSSGFRATASPKRILGLCAAVCAAAKLAPERGGRRALGSFLKPGVKNRYPAQ